MPERTCSVEDCDKPARSRGWCHMHYMRWWKTGSTEIHVKTVEERFWEKVDFDKLPGSCWGWTAAKNDYGYGTFRWQGKNVNAMRAAYELTRGPIPSGMQLDHLCHTFDFSCVGGVDCPHRECVNPDHLEVVTRDENYRRGLRNNHGARQTHCLRGHPFDEENTLVSSGRRYCRVCMRIREGRRTRRWSNQRD